MLRKRKPKEADAKTVCSRRNDKRMEWDENWQTKSGGGWVETSLFTALMMRQMEELRK
jgi:hypothetical protein